MKKQRLFFIVSFLFLFIFSVISCTMGGEGLFSLKKQLLIQNPPENALIRDSFVMKGRILTDKKIESIEVRFTEIGSFNPKTYGPFTAKLDQTEKRWEVHLNTMAEGTYPLSDGKYEVSLESLDINKKKSRQTIIYTIDNTKPVVVLASPVSESVQNPWEFSSRLLFTGSVYDESPQTQLIFNFYNENKEWICDYRETVSSEQWVLSINRGDTLYQSLKDSGASLFYFTVEAEDSTKSYKETQNNSDLTGNHSGGFYLAKDFVLDRSTEVAVSARTLHAISTESPLSYSEAQFALHKDDLASKKRSSSLDDLQSLTVFALREDEGAPYIQSRTLLQQQGSFAFKNTVSAKESLIFDFYRGTKGSAFSEDMAYSLKRKEGGEWVSVFQTGKKIQSPSDDQTQLFNQKIDIDLANIYDFSDRLVYVQEAPEVLGEYKIEFFVRDTNGLEAQETLWNFTLEEPSPTLFVELKEIKLDENENRSILVSIHSISPTEETFLSIKNIEGIFDTRFTKLKADKASVLDNSLFSLNWEVVLNSSFEKSMLSYLIFEVENEQNLNRLYKDFSQIWNEQSDTDVSIESEKNDTTSTTYQSIQTPEQLQELIKVSRTLYPEKAKDNSISFPHIILAIQKDDIEVHHDIIGEYYNLGYINSETSIPLVMSENLSKVYVRSERLKPLLSQKDALLWTLEFEKPERSSQDIVEIVAINTEGLESRLRLKVLFDIDAPFVKVENLKNSFYNKEKPLYISGLSIDISSDNFLQSGVEPHIEYAILKQEDFSDVDEKQKEFTWNIYPVENTQSWTVVIDDPSLFDSDGWYSFFVRARDNNGNYSTVSEASTLSFYVDSQAPIISFEPRNVDVVALTEASVPETEVFRKTLYAPATIAIAGFIDEKTYAHNGLSYWAYNKQFVSHISGENTSETVELTGFTFGNYWGIEDVLDEKGEYHYAFTAKDLAGNTNTIDYLVLVK